MIESTTFNSVDGLHRNIKEFFIFECCVFNAKVCRWRKQWVPSNCGMSCFSNAKDPDLFISKHSRGTVSTHRTNNLDVQVMFGNFLLLIRRCLLLWWFFSYLHKIRNLLLWYNHARDLTNAIICLQFSTSVVSSNWTEIFKTSFDIRNNSV